MSISIVPTSRTGPVVQDGLAAGFDPDLDAAGIGEGGEWETAFARWERFGFGGGGSSSQGGWGG